MLLLVRYVFAQIPPPPCFAPPAPPISEEEEPCSCSNGMCSRWPDDSRKKNRFTPAPSPAFSPCLPPQVITGSHDCQIKLWDLVAGKAMTTLTHHKKAVRAVQMHPKEFSFVSAAADNMKKWQVRKLVTSY